MCNSGELILKIKMYQNANVWCSVARILESFILLQTSNGFSALITWNTFRVEDCACRPMLHFFAKKKYNVCQARRGVTYVSQIRHRFLSSTEALKCNDNEFQCRFSEKCVPRHLLNKYKYECRRNKSILLPCRKDEGLWLLVCLIADIK